MSSRRKDLHLGLGEINLTLQSTKKCRNTQLIQQRQQFLLAAEKSFDQSKENQ